MISYGYKGIAVLIIMLFAAFPSQSLEIRGSIATDSFQWNSQNFPGFYYDIDRDIGTDTLTTTMMDGRLSEPDGIIYQVSNETEGFSNAEPDMVFGKMRVGSIDNLAGLITLDNMDNSIVLSKNKDIILYDNLGFRTADQDDVTADNPLRYYLYKEVIKPGIYEIRGEVATGDFVWSAQNFGGFYYDIDDDIGTEKLTTEITDGWLEEPNGIVYTTSAQRKDFEFADWGSYNVIGLMGEKYFAGYSQDENIDAWNQILFRASIDENSLVEEQLQSILLDDDTKMMVKKGESIALKEGYDLVLKGINSDGKIYLELLKDKKKVDEAFLAPSKEAATMADKTYYYRTDVGEQRGLVIIAVHFRSTYKDEDLAVAAVDGIWQISDYATDVRVDTHYGVLRINMVNADTLSMDNKDNPINLTRKSDIELMPGVRIRTANNDTLRYYIYGTEVVK